MKNFLQELIKATTSGTPKVFILGSVFGGRTTLLAQGEFTKFLNSKDDEKAAILEKITGVDIYAKVGKKGFEVTGQKEQLWKEARQQVEGIHTLSDDEVAAKKEEMAG